MALLSAHVQLSSKNVCQKSFNLVKTRRHGTSVLQRQIYRLFCGFLWFLWCSSNDSNTFVCWRAFHLSDTIRSQLTIHGRLCSSMAAIHSPFLFSLDILRGCHAFGPNFIWSSPFTYQYNWNRYLSIIVFFYITLYNPICGRTHPPIYKLANPKSSAFTKVLPSGWDCITFPPSPVGIQYTIHLSPEVTLRHERERISRLCQLEKCGQKNDIPSYFLLQILFLIFWSWHLMA